MSRLRIGINALYLIPGGVGGTEIYLRNLLRAFAEIDSEDEFVVFTNRETGPDLVPAVQNFRQAPQPVRAAIRPARIAWEQTGLAAQVMRQQLDVLFNAGFTAPAIVKGCPSVTVFHDLQHKRHPEYFRWFDLPFWRLCLYASARRSDLLIAVSESTRADLLRYYKLPDEKIRVIPHGVNHAFFDIGRIRKCTRPDAYFLCVSTLHPHKNLERLISAFAEFRRTRPDFRLVIAGLRGFHAEAIEALIGDLNLKDAVRLTGWIPDDDLRDLFVRASAFIYPTTFEGFGMPILEALAAGIPTACSSIQPLAGIAGDAAIQFDPNDTEAITTAMLRLSSDSELREKLAAAGPTRAAEFPWRKTAELTLKAIHDAAVRVRARRR